MANAATSVTMETFITLLTELSPDVSICVRGRHAIGKSEGVYQAATILELPVVERRLSQLTEGDIVGLPVLEGKTTKYRPCDWLIEACEKPVVLFLDERNRALDGVKQAVFQLTDSKTFYGNELHPETRIVIAENIGDDYQVQACDPAEVSRCATIILDPSIEEWLKYADGKCHPATIEFIRQNQQHLEHTGTFEPNKKYPDRRSWFKLDKELQKLGYLDNPDSPILHSFCGAFVGVEAASAFSRFCKERDREVSAKDILKNWKKAKKRLAAKDGISNAAYVECVSKLTDFLKKHMINEKESEQISAFMHDCPPEPRMACWSILQSNSDNLFKVHPLIETLMVYSASGKSTADLKPLTHAEVKKNKKATAGGAKKKKETGSGGGRGTAAKKGRRAK